MIHCQKGKKKKNKKETEQNFIEICENYFSHNFRFFCLFIEFSITSTGVHKFRHLVKLFMADKY